MWSETIGSGEDLVLVHGMGAAHSAWQLITPELSKSFRVTILDLPGHGNTPFDPNQNMEPAALAQLVIKQMNEIGINQFHVAGNSLGGWIVLEMAAMNPAQIKSVTALAPAGLWLTPFWTRTPFAAASKYLASGLKVVAPNLLKYEWARKMGFSLVSPLWPQFSYQLCLDATLAMGKSQGYFPAWDGFLTKRFDKRISPDIPVTIVFGDTDNSLPADTCQERILAPAHVRWVVLPETGHTPMWDHPHEVIAEIKATAGVLT
jgi:pimeloyl-ACP methyl ester carboxylesterase